jgi:hypothetical protein
MGLGRTEVKHAVHFGEGLGDQQTGPEQVAASPPEGDRLTPPEAAIHKDHDEETHGGAGAASRRSTSSVVR